MFAIGHKGWIGIDAGTSTVKVVQLARSGGGRLRIAGSAVIPRSQHWPTINMANEMPRSSTDELLAAVSLDPRLRGRKVAAMLPMTLCDVFTVDRPLEGDPNREKTVRQTIELATQRPVAHLQYDLWDVEVPGKDKPVAWSNVMTVDRNWSNQISTDAKQMRWACQAVDGLPFALARAVGMVQPAGESGPVAALDWGYARATFCVFLDRQPIYVRNLKGCGFQQILKTLVNRLDVSEEEAQSLLRDYGTAQNLEASAGDVAELIRELLDEPIEQLNNEYRRTVSHLQGQRRLGPNKVYLFGGGATIRGIAPRLARLWKTETVVWQLGNESSEPDGRQDPPDCLLGSAVALSALGWGTS